MLSKVCAAWLVVLVVLPFTPPFSTFDLADFLPGQNDRTLVTSSSKTPTAALTYAVVSRAVPFSLRSGRLRLTLTRLRAPRVTAVPAAASTLSAALPIDFVHPPSRPIVLRI